MQIYKIIQNLEEKTFKSINKDAILENLLVLSVIFEMKFY